MGRIKFISTILFITYMCINLPANNPAAIPQKHQDKNKWLARELAHINIEIEYAELDKVQIIFIGDSITLGWTTAGWDHWNKNFANPESPYYALNFGVGGDRTEHLLYRIQSKESGGMGNFDHPDLNPKVIVLKIGVNNTWKHSNEQIIEGIEEVVINLLDKKPQSQILLLSILPCSETERKKNRIIPINKALSEFPRSEIFQEKVVYFDLFSSFLDEEGKVDSNLYNEDGLHLSSEGYKKWADKIIPVLDEMLQN